MDIDELQQQNDTQHAEIKASIKDLNDKSDRCAEAIALLTGKMDTTKMIILYVVVPLIIILGGLVGIKLAFPSAL